MTGRRHAIAAAAVLGALAAGSTAGAAPVLAPSAPVVVPASPPPRGPQFSEDRAAQLGVLDPARQRPGSARRAIAEWLLAWHDRAWGRMLLWSDPVPAPALSAGDLRIAFSPARLAGWSVTRLDAAGDNGVGTVAVAVRPSLRAVLQRRTLRLAVRRSAGVWMVRSRDVVAPVAGALS
jgi:hypothetical protein